MTSQQSEIELKLDINNRDISRLQRYLRTTFNSGQAHALESVYFDTSKQHLRRAGFSLRVRHIGKRRIQTLKAAGEATAGLFVRPEWERDVDGDVPALDREAGLLQQFIPKRALADLRPIFPTTVRRTSFEVLAHGNRIEISFDQGDIRAGRRKRLLCEVELELKDGSPSPLFGLARDIGAVVPARLGVQSKAERGYDLAGSSKMRAVKAEPIALTTDMTSAKALQTIAQSCIRHSRLNEMVLSIRDDAVALHQTRVALRRLRSALTLFKPMLADERYEALRGEIKAMASTLGIARNIDVFIARFEDRPVPKVLRAARRNAYGQARATLDTARLRTLMLDLTEWLAIGLWLTHPGDSLLRQEPISSRAVRILDRSWKRLEQSGRGLATLDDDARHRVRIEAKKLRYAAEFFEALFPGNAAKRRRKVFGEAIEALLDSLGELNDLATAPALSREFRLSETSPLQIRSRKRLLTRAARQYDALLDVKPFWH